LAKRGLAAILLLGGLLRLGYGFAYPPPQNGLYDPDSYVVLASSVADSWSLSENGKPSAHREPAYPVALGLFFKLFGRSYRAVLGANIVFGLAALALLYAVGRRVFGEAAGLIAAGMAAVYPPFVFYCAQSLRETWMIAASALALWSLLEALSRRTPGWFAAAGAANALAALSNTVFLPFALAAAPAIIFLCRRERRPWAGRAGLYAAVLILAYAVWPVRNYMRFGTWVLGSTAGAGSTFYTFLIAPQETGGTPEQQKFLENDPAIIQSAGMDPLRMEHHFWKAGLERVRRAPWAYVRLVAWRFFWDMWRPIPRPRAYAHPYALVRLAAILTDCWIIPLGIVGMLWVRFRPLESLWLYLFLASTDLVYSLVLTMNRYRFSLMPWIILFAAVMLERGRARLKRAV